MSGNMGDMDVTEAIETRIEIRDYSDDPVDPGLRHAILDAGRLASSGRNLEHWRFILVDDGIAELAELSPTGGWVAGADFAVVICTDPEYLFHELDAGRALTYMQLRAWEDGVGSCIYTVDQADLNEHLGIPADFELTAVVGFGYPTTEIRGRKNRRAIEDIVFTEKFNQPYAE